MGKDVQIMEPKPSRIAVGNAIDTVSFESRLVVPQRLDRVLYVPEILFIENASMQNLHMCAHS